MYTKSELDQLITDLKADLQLAYTARRELMATGKVSEYKLNDGQTINQMIYRTPEQINSLIKGIKTEMVEYVNMRDGRIGISRDRDAKLY